jgi:hypothetical protein
MLTDTPDTTQLPQAQKPVENSRPIPIKKHRSLVARLMSFGRKGANREPRAVCFLVAVMVLVDKALPIDGLITEIGNASVIFRPASTFILDRTGAEVNLRFGDQEVRGSVTSVSSAGYDIRLSITLTDAMVSDILVQFGMATPAAAA